MEHNLQQFIASQIAENFQSYDKLLVAVVVFDSQVKGSICSNVCVVNFAKY